MNFDNIRCFISLAECLNFTRAAKKEHITQTAMAFKLISTITISSTLITVLKQLGITD